MNVHIIERKLLFYKSINVFQIFSDFHETSNDIFQSQGKDGKEKRNFERNLDINRNRRECELQLRAGNYMQNESNGKSTCLNVVELGSAVHGYTLKLTPKYTQN